MSDKQTGDKVPVIGGQVVIEVTKKHEMTGQNNKRLAVCFFGIFVCYFYYGILQEKITKGVYKDGEKTEKFTFTLALVFVQCIINAIFSRIVLGCTTHPADATPTGLYMLCSLSYLGAMLASNHSLQHVSYPTQVLGKSVKPIPVMILGVLLARKRYPIAKYFCVLMIVLGVAVFMYKDQKDKKDSAATHVVGIGEFLLLVSLTLDGMTGATQDRMRGDHKTNPHYMMLNINFWSIVWLAIALFVTGEGLAFLAFSQKYPVVWFNMISFSLASAVGQTFIFYTVTTFGPLTCSIITTTRKFFTILGSVMLFQHPMSSRQWLGTVLVFAGLSLDSIYGKER